jgi:hypothetical protein
MKIRTLYFRRFLVSRTVYAYMRKCCESERGRYKNFDGSERSWPLWIRERLLYWNPVCLSVYMYAYICVTLAPKLLNGLHSYSVFRGV